MKSGKVHPAAYRGPARCGVRTKELVKKLERGEIAVIDHIDLDSVAAQMLAERGPAAVVNLSPSISGRYPNRGPSILAQAGIPLIDVLKPELMQQIKDGILLEIVDGELRADGVTLGQGELQTREIIAHKVAESRKNLDKELQNFARNTFDYASQEVSQLLAPTQPPVTQTTIRGRHVMIVVRGEDYVKDLQTIRGYITGMKPVLVGVDGGADALLEMGMKPDIIVGDMDSVSDRALKCGAEIIVHTYADGRSSPGIERVKALGVDYQPFAVPGTSEDAAMLLAYEHGAELIVAVGTHSNLYDFLDKGRGGMASTMLVRMRMGSRLVDARGVSKLYTSSAAIRETFLMLLAGLIIAYLLVQNSEQLRSWLEVSTNWLRLWILERKFL